MDTNNNVVYYREQALETIARNIIKAYDSLLLLGSPHAIPIEEIIENYLGLKVEFQYIRNNGRILGETIFDNTPVAIYDKETGNGYTLIHVEKGTMIIDATLLLGKNDGRLRFTFAHELAHWLIHYEYYRNLGMNAAMKKTISKSSDADVRLERQADILAGHLLMPTGQVKKAFYQARRFSPNVVKDLANLFDVSSKAMEIKLKACGLI